MHIYLYVCMYICMHVCMYAGLDSCIYAWMPCLSHMFVCMHGCICVCNHKHVCTYGISTDFDRCNRDWHVHSYHAVFDF